MIFKVENGFKEKLKKDIGKRYMKSGLRLSGGVKENKISLCLEDDHGKRSNFLTRVFYGRLNGDTLEGSFRVSNYVLVLLGILLGFCVESIIVALITGALFGLILPCAVILCELIYFLSIKSMSKEHDELVLRYLEENKVED